MRQYVYTPQECGRSEWPAGTLRLEGIEITDDPLQAEVFVYPGALHEVKDPRELDRLPYMAGNEERHVFFHCSDDEVLYDKKCLFIRCNTRTWMLEKDPNTISWPWPVENFSECLDLPADGFKYDVSFQGWLWSNARKQSVESVQASGLKCDIAGYPDFCGYIYDTPEGVRRRAEFRRSMKESRIALCPESIPGVFPYRFFEAMSAGRVPLLVGSDFVLPFADEIPYAEFALFLESDHAKESGELIRAILAKVSDDELIRMGLVARDYWVRFLNRDWYPATMAYAVRKRLEVYIG